MTIICFGIVVSKDHDNTHRNLLILLMKKITFYYTNGTTTTISGPNNIKQINIEDQIFDKLECEPYEDYTYDKTTSLVSKDGVDGLAPFLNKLCESVNFDGVTIDTTFCCNTVMGFGTCGDNEYSIDLDEFDLKKLTKLHNKLLAQERIQGGFMVTSNVCT